MGLAGGIGDKLGNRYEGRWTVRCLARLLADEFVAIELEPYDGFKIEFRAHRADGGIELHQAKRSAPSSGNWTLGSLDREGLLAAMDHWIAPSRSFVLVSSSPASPDIQGLVDHARSRADPASFIAGMGADRLADLRGFQRHLGGVSDDRAMEILRAVIFRPLDEDTVKELTQATLALLVDKPVEAASHLGDYLQEHIGQRLTATPLWSFLADRGVGRRDWGSDPSVRAAVDHQVRRFRGDVDESAIGGLVCERPEASDIVGLLTADTGPSVVILSAPAGMGKSVVVRQVVDRLAGSLLVMPLRLDTVRATRADELGRQLGLPGSPAQVLAHLAREEKGILVVDQLDAVSQVSGRYAGGYEAVAELIAELGPHLNLRLFVACRDFDLEADTRLRRLRDRETSRTVEMGGLPGEFVDRVLDASGIRPDALDPAQRELVGVPLHLRLLAEAATPTPAFSTELDLFDAYWSAKRRSVSSRGGDEAAAAGLVDALAAEMSHRQELEVPVAVAHDRPFELEVLESEHVLIASGGRLRFFHERFFDYAFAVAFAATDKSLAEFLKATTQGLFRRSQARQILTYRRAADRPRYLRDLRETLFDPSIRFHLKALVLAWLRTLPQPEQDEWDVLKEAFADHADVNVAGHVMSLLAGAAAFFDLADGAGVFEQWLHEPDKAWVDRAIGVLAPIQRQRPSRVAALLATLDCDDDQNRARLIYLVRHSDLTVDEAYFEFFLGLIRKGCLDDLRRVFAINDSFWDLAHGLGKRRPAWAAQFIRTYLERRLSLAAAAGVEAALDDADWVPDPLEQRLFATAAAGAPAAFAEQMVPLVLEVVDRRKRWNAEERRYDDETWRWRWFGRSHRVAESLLGALEDALRSLAASDPATFRRHRTTLEVATSSTADHVLARAFAGAPVAFAADAADWLIANPARLGAGYVDAPHWVGRELVEAIWPHLDPTQREALEVVLLAYYPSWERSVQGHGAFGSAQFTILSGVGEDLLSRAGRRRLQELRRKFGSAPRPPHGVEVGWVGSPVPPEAVPRMNDANWLSALSEYVGVSDRIRDRPPSLSGGALELGRQLQEAATKEPDRFARLGIGLSDELASAYGEAVLFGISKADGATPDLVFDLVRRLNAAPGKPGGRHVGDTVASVAARAPAPDDIVQIVAWHATSDPDPLPGDEKASSARDDPVRLGLLEVGINSTRGSTAQAIARILAARPSSLGDWRETIETMTHDASDAVRACVAGVLLEALPEDRDWALERTVAMFTGHDDVATSMDGERLIARGLRSHPTLLLPLVEHLVGATDEGVARVGARLASLAAFALEEAQPVADQALSGNAGARYGAAEVYAANVGDLALRPRCRVALLRLFTDPDERVRREAATCFRGLEGLPLAQEEDLFLAYAGTPALADNPHSALAALVATPDLPTQATIAIGKAVVEAAGSEAASIASAWSGYMPDVARLAARLHAHADPEVSEAGLDIIDALAANWAYGLDKAIASFER